MSYEIAIITTKNRNAIISYGYHDEVGSLTSEAYECWSTTDSVAIGNISHGVAEIENMKGSLVGGARRGLVHKM